MGGCLGGCLGGWGGEGGGRAGAVVTPFTQLLLAHLEETGGARDLIQVKRQTMLGLCDRGACGPPISLEGYNPLRLTTGKVRKVLQPADVLQYITNLDPATDKPLAGRTWRVYEMVGAAKGVMAGEEVRVPPRGAPWGVPAKLAEQVSLSFQGQAGTYRVRPYDGGPGSVAAWKPKFFVPRPPKLFGAPKALPPVLHRIGGPREKLVTMFAMPGKAALPPAAAGLPAANPPVAGPPVDDPLAERQARARLAAEVARVVGKWLCPLCHKAYTTRAELVTHLEELVAFNPVIAESIRLKVASLPATLPT